MLFGATIDKTEVKAVPLRVLAHLGDAVFHLYEREREVMSTASAQQMHRKTVSRVSAERQSELLTDLMPHLTDEEQEIVRMARNLKPTGYRKAGQSAYRKSTAFEALIGYLYLTTPERLRQILDLLDPKPIQPADEV